MSDNLQPSIHDLANDHALLEECLDQVEDLLSPIDETTAAVLANMLPDIQSRCAKHMDREEQGGYFPALRERAPHFESKLDDLCSEHVTLKKELTLIIESLDSGPVESVFRVEIAPRLRQWIVNLRDHEHRENSIVQEAFNQDIGEAD